MKKTLISLAAVVATAAVLHAGPPAKIIEQPAVQAVGAWYVAANGGMSAYQSNFINKPAGNDWSSKRKIGWNGGLKLGYDFDTNAFVRPVLELDGQFTGFNRNETMPTRGQGGVAKFQTNSFALTLNALAKFDCVAFQPYVGAGAGFHHTWMKERFNDERDSDSSTGFALQAIAGCDYKIAADWALFLEYKWLHFYNNKQLTGHHPEGMTKSQLGQQLINMGVRFQF